MNKLNVLIVDDERAFRETLLRRLRRRGLAVRDAESGNEALRCLSGWKADVVVLDVKMADMDGIETLAHIREEHPDIQVVLLTGHADVEAARQGMAGGAYDYMLKPIAIEELMRAVEAAGEHAQAARRKSDLNLGTAHPGS